MDDEFRMCAHRRAPDMGQQSGARVTAQRHHGLDATRGICALLVVAYHFMSWTGIGTYPSLGLYAVYAFFILSSVTLCLVYGDKFSEIVTRPALVRFAVNRAARILPLLCAVAVATFVLRVVQGGMAWQEGQSAVLTASGLFAFGAPGVLANATGAWSVGIEILFYFLFPILCLFLLHRSARWLILLAAALLVAQNIHIAFAVGNGTLVRAWGTYTEMLSFAYYFAVGFAIYKIRFKSRFGLVVGLSVLMLAIGASFASGVTDEVILSAPYSIIIPVTMGIGILLIYNSAAHPRAIRAFEFLGAISYSSYLLHPLVFTVVASVEHRLGLSLPVMAVLFVISTLVVAHASYALFEIPARNWVRQLAGTEPVPANVGL
jgi:peptidoglycan/LPS O-acetylase OafA/YrhL